MSIQDYEGRTIDLLAYQDAGPPGSDTLLTMALIQPTNSGQVTTGIQKLAQRFLLELLTIKGSLTYLPTRGCDFIQNARSGSWRTPMDVMSAFSASLLDIKNNLINEESTSDPDDERFADAHVLAVSLSAGIASMTVKVTSRAGDSREVIAPLNTTV